jgi:hypothetical protein
VFFVMTIMASERAKMIVNSGQGDEGGGLVRVVFWPTPNNVGNGDGFVRHEGAKVRDQGLISWTDARRVIGSG